MCLKVTSHIEIVECAFLLEIVEYVYNDLTSDKALRKGKRPKRRKGIRNDFDKK